ncbi:MAG: InlB B-repeat-containing protein, partial [Clostridia bacterium]|nr:InlB B-repeat-containing protein [Clostridia bacterium]
MKKLKSVFVILLTVSMLVPLFATTSFAATYTITFDANGGTGGPGTKTYYDAATIPSTEPTKSGMTFRGWATSAENAGKGIVAYSYNAKYGGSKTYSSLTSTRLYAVWAYSVKLHHGNEGWGSSAYQLYKYPNSDLPLYHTKSTVYPNYGMLPGATGVTNDQRVFIMWATGQDGTTSKGTGKTYVDRYTDNANVTLYAIWGFRIQYYADGGTFPSTGTDKYLTYVCNYDGSNYQNPKTLYGNFDFPSGDLAPVKQGCRLKTHSSGELFYLLLWSDMRPFTTESAKQNLTIPPTTTSGLNWSHFHTTTCATGDTAIEFYACWEPSITYKANGAQGNDIVDYLEFDGWNKGVHVYSPYTVMNESDANKQFTKQNNTFIGWNTKADGSGVSYAPGSTISNLDSSDPITLYAQWKELHTHVYTGTVTKKATCTEKGVKTFTCECGDSYTEDIPALGHTFGEWSVVTPATTTSEGL